MARKSSHWMQRAVKRPGAFTAKARRAGKSVSAEARSVLKPGSRASTRTKRQAALARTFKRMARRRKRSHKRR